MSTTSRTPIRSLMKGGIVAGFLAASGTVATAADLGGYSPPPDFAPPIGRQALDIERWTGFYMGGTLGAGFGSGRTGGDIGRYSFDQSGALGTIYAGYNWQIGRAILGLETDLGTGNLKSDTATASGTLRTELNAMGSFRGRAGFLMTPSLMLYGTAGLGWANFDFGRDGTPAGSQTFTGLQLGVGGEYMLSRNVALRLEYVHTDFGREALTHGGQINSYRPDFDTVRAGISFKF